MSTGIDHIVILGSTLTALSLARHCRSLGIDCDVLDTKSGPAALSRIPTVTLLDEQPTAKTLETVAGLSRGEASALIADSDSWLRWLKTCRSDLESAFGMVLHPDNDVLGICLDKSRFLAWCHEHDLPAPRLYERPGRNGNASPAYPLLVRPKLTLHGVQSSIPKAAEVRNEDELMALLIEYDRANVDATICESLLRDRIRQFSVGLARNKAGDVRALVAEKLRPPPAWCAGGTYVVADHDDRVHELAVAAASRIGLFGVAEIEILMDEATTELFLIEINPRPWVQYSIAWQSGYDLLTFTIDPDRYDAGMEARTGRRWLSFKDDLYVAMSRSEGMIKNGELTLRQYIADLLAANVFAYWSLADIRPWTKKAAERLGRGQGA